MIAPELVMGIAVTSVSPYRWRGQRGRMHVEAVYFPSSGEWRITAVVLGASDANGWGRAEVSGSGASLGDAESVVSGHLDALRAAMGDP